MKESKKAIRQAIVNAFNQVMSEFNLSETDVSKKTRKLVEEASKKISEHVKLDIKKKLKIEAKLAKQEKPVLKKKVA
jgi:hypothetical protein